MSHVFCNCVDILFLSSVGNSVAQQLGSAQQSGSSFGLPGLTSYCCQWAAQLEQDGLIQLAVDRLVFCWDTSVLGSLCGLVSRQAPFTYMLASKLTAQKETRPTPNPNAFQTSACIMVANVQLAKACPMAKPSVSIGGECLKSRKREAWFTGRWGRKMGGLGWPLLQNRMLHLLAANNRKPHLGCSKQ